MDFSKNSSFMKMEEMDKNSVAINLKLERDIVDVSRVVKKRGRKRKRDDSVDIDPEVERKRITANSQERVRMHKINEALEQLRKCLPQQFHLYHRRMSKIRTLRLAMNYITSLTELIRDDDLRRQGEYIDMGTQAQQIPAQVPTSVMYEVPTTFIPYYPYTSIPDYHPYSAIESMYRTPDQQTSSCAYNPRQLDFNTMSSCAVTQPLQDDVYSESNFTPPKALAPKCLFLRDGVMHTPEFTRSTMRTETVSSACQASRNRVEVKSEIQGPHGDAEGQLEPGQIRSRRNGPCRALVKLIDEDDDD